MNRSLQLIIVTASVIWGTSQAQTRTSTIKPSIAETAATQTLLTDYVYKYNGTNAGVTTLEAIASRHLAITPENVSTLRTELAKKRSAVEKVALIRLLGQMHTHDNKSKMNDLITRDLRAIVHSGDERTARAATLTFSRLGYSADLDGILQFGLSHNFITEDERFGELAHVVRFAPAKAQLVVFKILLGSKNRYSSEILANNFSDYRLLHQLYPESLQALDTVLAANEPHFAMAIANMSYIDALRYAEWLHVRAAIATINSNAAYDAYILDRLTSKDLDPRKIIAFLTSEPGKKMIHDVHQPARFTEVLNKIDKFNESFPGNDNIAPLIAEVHAIVEASKL